MFDPIVQFIENSGVWVYVLAPLFMVVVAILPIPAEIPAMLNGMVFGPQVGTVITWSGALVGALVSFELARRFGRPLGKRVVKPARMAAADRLVLSAGWPGLITLRLVPTIAFTVVNWAAGLTPVSRWTFAWTTAVGIIPGCLLFTLSGSGLGALYRRNPGLAVTIAGLILLVGVWTLRRYRKRHPASAQAASVH
ncbi:MAG: VTT domain-containing protein [Gemmatimonadota bacterium]|nr:VTT domain-containing protein [Gemmatimonadota bacterium]